MAGISLLEYYLLLFSRFGINDAAILIGHLGEKVVQLVKSNRSLSINLDFINQTEQLGTGHAVSMLRESAGDEDFLLIYSDVFIGSNDLKRLLEVGSSSEFDHVVAVARVTEPWKFGVVLEDSGLLKGIIEKPERGTEPSNKVIAGAFYFNNSIFSFLEGLSKSPRGEYELTDAIREAARCGKKVKVLDLEGGWTDAGTFSNLLVASKLLFQEMIREELYLDLRWTYQDGLFGPGTKESYPEVEVQGPVFIGSNVEIGRGSRIGPYTVLFGDVVIGEEASVSNSILLKGARVGEGSIIEASILSDGSYVGKEVKLKRRPEPGEFGMVLGEGARVNDLTEVEPGAIFT